MVGSPRQWYCCPMLRVCSSHHLEASSNITNINSQQQFSCSWPYAGSSKSSKYQDNLSWITHPVSIIDIALLLTCLLFCSLSEMSNKLQFLLISCTESNFHGYLRYSKGYYFLGCGGGEGFIFPYVLNLYLVEVWAADWGGDGGLWSPVVNHQPPPPQQLFTIWQWDWGPLYDN